jgi:lipoprotein-releasing system permease protein
VNFELFIVKRIISGASGKKTGINVLVNISVIAIALSLAVMIISVAVLTGFKKEIKDKLTGFGSHIQISNLDTNNSYEAEPVELSPAMTAKCQGYPSLCHQARHCQIRKGTSGDHT